MRSSAKKKVCVKRCSVRSDSLEDWIKAWVVSLKISLSSCSVIPLVRIKRSIYFFSIRSRIFMAIDAFDFALESEDLK
ncbi:MAG: hypothetical protein P4L49_10300 [Desulfosporosinus sp.]|nr:hypothetical protein [Desulfosporosinus sp.]